MTIAKTLADARFARPAKWEALDTQDRITFLRQADAIRDLMREYGHHVPAD